MATTLPVEQSQKTALKLQHSSPLDTLVRRTSARRARATTQTQSQSQSQSQTQSPVQLFGPYPSVLTSQDVENGSPYGGYIPERTLTPPRHPFQQQGSPSSPLLHSHFSRNSTATTSIDESYMDTRLSTDSKGVGYRTLEYRYRDDESIYSQDPPSALRDSAASSSTIRPRETAGFLPSRYLMTQESQEGFSPERSKIVGRMSPIPALIVSSPATGEDGTSSRAGRTPIVRPNTSNFSRPVRPESTSHPSQVVAPPSLPPHSEEQKRRVLERNVNRGIPQSPKESAHGNVKSHHRRSMSFSDSNPYVSTPGSHIPRATPSQDSFSSSLHDPYAEPTTVMSLQASNRKASGSPIPPAPDQYLDRGSRYTPIYGARQYLTPTQPVELPRQPPSRSNSPASLYSSYSYYDFGSAAPSPMGCEFSTQPTRVPHTPQSQQQPSAHLKSDYQSDYSPKSPNSGLTPVATEPQTPQDFLQLGIQHHEANRLKESAIYFEKSAKEGGGCGVGMLMWGLTLRHGWGCEKNEKVGFRWLRKAAEHAVVDLESARDAESIDIGSVQDELVLAIYEVGQCFFHGWGISKDQKMAVSYYTVAARLGDPDAQHDLAFCLANGKGCKKDRKESAKWYRAAVAQGASDVGLAWIYKEKFM